MATLREIKRRIVSIKSTEQITKAMKMVAAAKLRKAQENIIAARPYARGIDQMIKDILKKVKDADNPLFLPKEVNRLGLLVVTADRGLCGSFNTNLIKHALQVVNDNMEKEIFLFTVGRKAGDFFRKRNYSLLGSYDNIFNDLHFSIASDIMDSMVNAFLSGKIDKLVVVYNEFKSAVQQNIVTEQLLPIVPDDFADEDTNGYDYIYEPAKEELINSLLPKHLNMQMWKILLESNAAEQGARMTAMENATENANEMISTLTLQYNRARQSSITTELSEIVGGAEALKG